MVFGQVLPYTPALERFSHRSELRAQMAATDQNSGSPLAIPHTRMVSTDRFPLRKDHVHYSAAGQLMLGSAMAKAILELQK